MSEYDVYLFREGKHSKLYEKLGSHVMTVDGNNGVHFGVWAPNAKKVSVVGDFNSWTPGAHLLLPHNDDSGLWEGFVPNLTTGSLYKYHVASRYNGYAAEKGDPFAFKWEVPPRTASVVCDLEHDWSDDQWCSQRSKRNSLESPLTFYECHLASWRRIPQEQNRSLTYVELSNLLPKYVSKLGFTHVEFLPVMEHPFFGSWGYQMAGYFAPSSRLGTPSEFMGLVDALHQAEVGVVLDWVPSHFPTDDYALGYYDGTHLFEYPDPRKGINRDWGSYVFDFGRGEVRSFLTSSGTFWLSTYHADGLRLDAVSSMLYLDYSRPPGEWVPNVYGGRENLEAVSFLKSLNELVYSDFPDRQMVAEESTAWPMVSRPTSWGGLGFGMKWNMGWMHDTLEYFSKDPVHRRFHQNELTFSLWYAFTENFILPLSHDEVVHGKGSLLSKMPGDEWQKFANLRLLLGLMYGHPGKKLLFMGAELGERNEWNHEGSPDWRLLNEPKHEGIQRWVSDLNGAVRREPALHQFDFDSRGFEWVDMSDAASSVLSFLRKGTDPKDSVLVVCNNTPVPRRNYFVGIPRKGTWSELLNSDAEYYGGSGMGNFGEVETNYVQAQGKPYSLNLTLPPLACLFLRRSFNPVTVKGGRLNKFVCIHGHFYQPPRENPWTGKLDEDPSASPFHDWNERITAECYGPNSTAPLLDDQGRISGFVNNYSRISFDFGPTLLNWLECNSPETYESILEADRESVRLLDGHGGGMAQVYNHMIMPLALLEERRIQTKWGVEDFKRRYGRDPEGMWLPETAADTLSLECLAENGIKFTILSPLQALATRKMGERKWADVSGSRIDTRRPYSCVLPSGKSISIFFYDKSISTDLAFGSLLETGDGLAKRLMGVYGESGEPQMVSLASDGETFGHHHKQGHVSLARCVSKLETGGQVRVTNFGHFLSVSPPSHEVRIVEPSSWSCPHGVERWRSDCGCGSEIRRGYNQEWRAPLRGSLDWLHKKIDDLYHKLGPEVFVDARESRYYLGSVSMENREELAMYARARMKKGLTAAQRVMAESLAEMIVCASLMFASCAWFWEDISRPEPVQALRFAARGIELVQMVGGLRLESEFELRLARAKPNDKRYRTGVDLYRRLRRPED
jgi:1,4-alpha-glucan branching enzyme